jgi:sugar lactone lactonase YvrE
MLETTEAERLASGFKFTEGPTWHPDGYWYFVAPLENKLMRLTPGKPAELVRMTEGGIGTTLDLQGRLILCEATGRRITRTDASGKVETLADKYKGGRLTFRMVGRRIFADMNEGEEPGIPDGIKVDSLGRVFCSGSGGIWVFSPDGKRLGIIRWPEQATNFAFGGPDLRTLLCCAATSVYSLRVKVPGNPLPWYKLRG